MFLKKRSYEKELMDDYSIDDERIIKALNELKIINKFLGGNSTAERGFKILINQIGSANNFIVLDAGGGGSSDLSSLKINSQIKIYNIDINKGVNHYIIENQKSIVTINGDVFNLPVKKKSFDAIYASLFLHHFNEDEIKEILSHFIRTSKKGIVINDLHRSVFALIGIKLLTYFFSKSELVKNDASLSVKRGFKRKELVNILEELNLDYIIKRNWAFRWLVVINLNDKKENERHKS